MTIERFTAEFQRYADSLVGPLNGTDHDCANILREAAIVLLNELETRHVKGPGIIGPMPREHVERLSGVTRPTERGRAIKRACTALASLIVLNTDNTRGRDGARERITAAAKHLTAIAAASGGAGKAGGEGVKGGGAGKAGGEGVKGGGAGVWLVRAMLLVRNNPEWSDAKIAKKVGKVGGTLSRSRDYQAAAALARKQSSKPAGRVVIEGKDRTIEAMDEGMGDDEQEVRDARIDREMEA